MSLEVLDRQVDTAPMAFRMNTPSLAARTAATLLPTRTPSQNRSRQSRFSPTLTLRWMRTQIDLGPPSTNTPSRQLLDRFDHTSRSPRD